MFPFDNFVNHVLAQQPWARDRLVPHVGKTARIDASVFKILLVVTADGEVRAAPEGAVADIAFRIDPAQLPRFLTEPEAALKAVHIEGDAEFAQLIAQLLREVRWDPEEDLSRLVGDVPAHRAMRLARSLDAWGREAARRLTGTTAAFLVDEEPLLVKNRMQDEFAAGVADARDACARLEKRIERLERQRAPEGRG